MLNRFKFLKIGAVGVLSLFITSDSGDFSEKKDQDTSFKP